MIKSIKATKKTNKLNKLVKDNRGATIVEYAVLLAIIMVIGIVGYQQLGGKVSKAGQDATSAFTPSH